MSLFTKFSRAAAFTTSLIATATLGIPSPSSATSITPTLRPSSATCSNSTRYSAEITHAWDALEPVQECSIWKFELPAMAYPPAKRRSEVWWAIDGHTRAYSPGQTVVIQTDVEADLGAAARSNHDWHVLWQLHGPRSGEWHEPVMVLGVRDGMLHVQGGNGHPRHIPGSRSYWWSKPLKTFENKRAYRVRIESYLSTNTSAAWLSVSVDDEKILERWRPVSSAGNHPGTIYPDQPIVYSRSGLYRGTDTGYTRPTYLQVTTQRNLYLR